MMKRMLTTIAAISMVAGISQAAPISFGDDFSSGNLDNWHQKWTAEQNGLFTTGGGAASLSGLAEVNYHAQHTTGFTLVAGETGTVTSRIQLDHTGVLPTQVNDTFFGLLLKTGDSWWAGSVKGINMANRNGAVGNRLTSDPWIEGWVSWGNLGVNTNTGGVGNWFDLTMNMSVSNGTIWTQGILDYGSGSYTMTAEDTGIAAGTTVYAGYSTFWNGGGTNMMASGSMNQVNVDDFAVSVIPEPATLGLVAFFGGAVLFIRRSFKI